VAIQAQWLHILVEDLQHKCQDLNFDGVGGVEEGWVLPRWFVVVKLLMHVQCLRLSASLRAGVFVLRCLRGEEVVVDDRP